MENIKILSEIFQSFGIGLGAILAGLGGLIVFLDRKDKKSKENYLKKLKNRYPRSLINQEYQIAHTMVRRGWFFVLDHRTKTKHWVKNMETMNDMGFSSADGIIVDDKDFNKYKEGEEIDTN